MRNSFRTVSGLGTAIGVLAFASAALAGPSTTLTIAFSGGSSPSAVPFTPLGLLVIGSAMALAAVTALRFRGAGRRGAFVIAGLLALSSVLVPRPALASNPTLSLTTSPSSGSYGYGTINVTNNAGGAIALTSITQGDPTNFPFGSGTCHVGLVMQVNDVCTVIFAS